MLQDLWVASSRYIAPLLNEGNNFSFGDDLSGGLIKKLNLNLIYKLLPLKTTIGIPIMICYIVELECLKCGLWVLTCNMQTSTW